MNVRIRFLEMRLSVHFCFCVFVCVCLCLVVYFFSACGFGICIYFFDYLFGRSRVRSSPRMNMRVCTKMSVCLPVQKHVLEMRRRMRTLTAKTTQSCTTKLRLLVIQFKHCIHLIFFFFFFFFLSFFLLLCGLSNEAD